MNHLDELLHVDFTKYYQISQLHVLPNRIALFEHLDELQLTNKPFVCHTTTLAFHTGGCCDITVNDRPYRLTAGRIVIITPGQVVTLKHMSPDATYICVAVTNELINETESRRRSFEELFAKMQHNAMFQLTPTEASSVFATCELLKHKFGQCYNNDSHKALFTFLVLSLFCECRGYLYTQKNGKDQLLSPKERIFKEFIHHLSQHYTSERSIAFYATCVGISPKQLAAIVESVSKRSAKEWIDQYVIQEARRLLLTTDLSIQEIADGLHFSDQSFFGKYFHRIEKMSPFEYRKQKRT